MSFYLGLEFLYLISNISLFNAYSNVSATASSISLFKILILLISYFPLSVGEYAYITLLNLLTCIFILEVVSITIIL